MLKGRERLVPDEARTCWRKIQSAQVGRAKIGPSDPTSALSGPSIWRPLQGASPLGGQFPGLKPWAEVCSPFGAAPLGQHSVPEGQPDRSLARSAWECAFIRTPYCRVRYDRVRLIQNLVPPTIESVCTRITPPRTFKDG
jgi:hypothetical protein